MSRSRRKPKGKKINPTFFVFCEGKTEVAYISFLKSEYRIPSIIIHAKIGGNDINNKHINDYKRTKSSHKKDMTFLFYDLDVPKMLERLKKVDNSILLVSNPCLELWFLLHYKNQKTETNSEYCFKELKNRNGVYKKGQIDAKLKEKLKTKKREALIKAKNLKPYTNPSSSVYKFIEILEELKKV